MRYIRLTPYNDGKNYRPNLTNDLRVNPYRISMMISIRNGECTKLTVDGETIMVKESPQTIVNLCNLKEDELAKTEKKNIELQKRKSVNTHVTTLRDFMRKNREEKVDDSGREGVQD